MVRALTHQQTEYSPIQSSQPHKDAAVILWFTTAAAAMRTHQQSRVEFHEFSRVMVLDAACFNLVSQTPVFGHGGRNGCRAHSCS
jgi:hypothetical protein